ncbi:hypothetical protein MKZ38_008739 [Zalerion maritima]|uniref:Alpha/beta hydrolase fold-3 domain-containing protein n=1 Tax=Zalerion maritima TaxID=339359 RepID=A0AAD5RHB5_9PEZI|nr:hypothetical protein MKZ38_008739 [Zalerion maritima]
MAPLTISVNECSPEARAERQAINQNLENLTNSQTHWFEAPSAEEYRKWRKEGLNGFPKPFHHPQARVIQIPSDHGAHTIPLRIIPPKGEAKGVFLHFHAGGFVIGSAAAHDSLLSRIADDLSLVVVSVEYRLAPEHIFPAAAEDCLDAALFALSPGGVAELGGRLRVIAGESAGSYLTLSVTIQLRDRGIDVAEKLDAIVPSYGIFDLTYTPSVRSHKRRVIMGSDDAEKFIDAYLPLDKFPLQRRQEIDISPLYNDLSGLPPALFLCGTADPLLDDSVFMASRYSLAGSPAELKLVAEACHGFTIFPLGDVAEEGIQEVLKFVSRHVK